MTRGEEAVYLIIMTLAAGAWLYPWVALYIVLGAIAIALLCGIPFVVRDIYRELRTPREELSEEEIEAREGFKMFVYFHAVIALVGLGVLLIGG